MNVVLLVLTRYLSMRRVGLIILMTMIVLLIMPMGVVLALTNGSLISVVSGVAKNQTVYTGSDNPADTYFYGYCTYWAALRRLETGDPIPNTWGNAITWAVRAQADGYIVDHIPSVGAIYQWSAAPGGLGHVAYVEAVDPTTGAWTISEMNAPNWDVTDERTLPASQAILYEFIHDKAQVND